MSRLLIVLGFVAAVLLITPSLSPACPFCSMQGQTLTMEVNQASLVVYGTLTNPKAGAGNDLETGTTDIAIEDIIKDHPYLKGKKTVTLPRYIPVNPNDKVKFLVFCDLFKERLDPYRGIPVKDKEIVQYLKGAFAVKDKDIAERLAFFFKHLDSADAEIATDAYKEFSNADAKDVTRMLEKGDRAAFTGRLAKWLKDPDTPSYRYGLYGYLLGSCGTSQDADVLVNLLKDPQRGLVSGIDGVLAGYILLRPKEGWQYVTEVLADANKEFTRRYAALRTVRFLWETRPDIIPRRDLLDGLKLLLDQGDIADLAIEDLRKWKQCQAELLDKILSLREKESHNAPIVHRAILRYALSCPADNTKAQAFLADQRRKDPERVKDAEELLKLEQPLK